MLHLINACHPFVYNVVPYFNCVFVQNVILFIYSAISSCSASVSVCATYVSNVWSNCLFK